MSFPGITNHVVPVKGTSVTCYIGVRDVEPHVWIYSLWTNPDDPSREEDLIATGQLDFSPEACGIDSSLAASFGEWSLKITPEQVANVAFLLEVEYK